MKRGLLSVVVLGALLAPGPGHAATDHELLALYSQRYISPEGHGSTITIATGDTISFANLDPAYVYGGMVKTDQKHTVQSDIVGLFATSDVTFGRNAAVVGVSSLSSGTYKFHCRYHAVYMTGTLIVT